MNKLLLSTLGLLLFCNVLSAQSEGCSTQQDEQFFERLEANLKRSNQTVEKGYVPRIVPIQFHVATDNNGSNGFSENRIIDAMCTLNDRYAEADIFFYIDGINYINNTNLNSRPRLSSSVSTMRSNRNQNAMNIFLVSEILQNDGSPSGSAGYYSGGNNDFVVMLKTQLGNERFTIEHEIGHFFSLPHTHVGWEGDISQGASSGGYQPEVHGDTVHISFISGSTQAGTVEVELVDGSNCTTAGDRICDTPPDYGFGQSCSCCQMVYEVWDRNGDRIEPMIDNVMSYSEGCTPFLFSQEQIITMQSDIDSPGRNYLRTGQVSEYTPITEQVNLIAPVQDQLYDNFDGVHIEWDPVANAEEYRVNISGTQQLSFLITDTELYLTELQPNGLYILAIDAINKFGTGCQDAVQRVFFTGTGSTSVNETSFLSDLKVVPNPAISGQEMYLKYTSAKRLDAKVQLLAINGQKMWSRNLQIGNGQGQLIIPANDYNSGLYLLKIEIEEGIIIEKIIIE
jgi:hypothetical protein